jgi:hypothetical protein
MLPEVRYDALLGVTGLFSQRSRLSSREPIELGNGEQCSPRLWMRCPVPLAAWDQSVYFAVIAAITKSGSVVTANTITPDDTLWHRLQVTEDGTDLEAGTATVSWRELSRLAGARTHGGKTVILLKRALERLASVTCWFNQPPVEWGAKLISWERTKRGVQLALHPHATRVALGRPRRGGKPWRYALVSLSERYALLDRRKANHLQSQARCEFPPLPVAQVTHAWLSAWMRRIESRKIRSAALANRMYSDSVDRRSGAARQRAVRRGLEAIGTLPGWKVSFDGDQCRISRHSPGEAHKPGIVDPKVVSCGPENRSAVVGSVVSRGYD